MRGSVKRAEEPEGSQYDSLRAKSLKSRSGVQSREKSTGMLA